MSATLILIPGGAIAPPKGVPMQHEITLQWNPNPLPVSGYNVYRSNSSGTEVGPPLNGSAPIQGTSFVDTVILTGKVYYYKITAVLNGVESPDSAEVVSLSVPFPPSPAPIDMGLASSFGVLAATAITNTGAD